MIQYIIKEHHLDPVNLPLFLSADNVRLIKSQLLSIFKTVYHKARLEQRLLEQKQIQYNIQLRCNNYDENLTKMINSILNREKHSIVLDRLLYKDPVHGSILITDAHTIQKHAIQHFQQYAIPHTAPVQMNDRWINQFTPRTFINNDWYQSVMTSPTWDEWIATLQSLPNDKACGPSKLHNEFYKHAGLSTKKLT